jgi:serine/threonine protein kinase
MCTHARKQVICIAAYMHTHRECHTDMGKMLHGHLHRCLQVADFGLAAVVISDSLACSKVGTPLYMAPEQIQGAGYTAKSDMWALGCIIYEVRA